MKHTASNAPSFLAGRTTLIMCALALCLTSCQVGVYKGLDGRLYRVPPEILYYNQYPAPNPAPTYSYPQPVAAQQPQVQRSVQPKPRTSLATVNAPQVSQRPIRSQSKHVTPPIPREGYNARLDTRRTAEHPNGLFWVVDTAGNLTKLPPDKFWRWRAECLRHRVSIRAFDQYDPDSRF